MYTRTETLVSLVKLLKSNTIDNEFFAYCIDEINAGVDLVEFEEWLLGTLFGDY